MQDAGCTGFLGSVEALFVLLVFLVRCIYCAVSVWEGSAEAFRNEVYPGGGGVFQRLLVSLLFVIKLQHGALNVRKLLGCRRG